eukprot:2686155-Alexandrium_andersonii.AAC.1
MVKSNLAQKPHNHPRVAPTGHAVSERSPRTRGVGAEDELASRSSEVRLGMIALKTVMKHSMLQHRA